MIRRLRSERGTVLATTVILMSLMTMGGLATYAYVDGQTVESGRERVRETSFNVGEGLLGAQVFFLSRDWPGTTQEQYPTSCSGATTSGKCPNGASLISAFGGPDVAKGVTWQTRVVDNKLDNPRLSSLPADTTARCASASRATPSYYDDAAMTASPLTTYDQNGDCRMWVRAQASIDGRPRTFVGLVRVEQVVEEFPKRVITAGKVKVGNSGNKVLINTQGDAAQPSSIAVRCSESSGDDCVGTQKEIQISPRNIEYDYPSPTALTPDALERLRERAKSLGTYHSSVTGCPATLAGPLVFIETGTIVCTGNSKFNSEEYPGILIVANGTAEFGGTTVFYGIVHMANLQNSSGWVLRTSGTGLIKGSVAVDGPGGVLVEASAENLVYDDGVFSRVVSYGSAGIIQNTWREIVPAS
ncbi:MAG: hypothetical protein M3141_00830 [Actinomycetota bacterium]|nr:hypothetical protein [Actinomycetota bacterium]